MLMDGCSVGCHTSRWSVCLRWGIISCHRATRQIVPRLVLAALTNATFVLFSPSLHNTQQVLIFCIHWSSSRWKIYLVCRSCTDPPYLHHGRPRCAHQAYQFQSFTEKLLVVIYKRNHEICNHTFNDSFAFGVRYSSTKDTHGCINDWVRTWWSTRLGCASRVGCQCSSFSLFIGYSCLWLQLYFALSFI